jgi:hypothetical protein
VGDCHAKRLRRRLVAAGLDGLGGVGGADDLAGLDGGGEGIGEGDAVVQWRGRLAGSAGRRGGMPPPGPLVVVQLSNLGVQGGDLPEELVAPGVEGVAALLSSLDLADQERRGDAREAGKRWRAGLRDASGRSRRIPRS